MGAIIAVALGGSSGAVAAVFQELRAAAYPMYLALTQAGGISPNALDSYGDLYRQVAGSLYVGLPVDLAGQLSKVYGLLCLLRASLHRGGWQVAGLLAIYNDDVRGTLGGLHDYALRHGLNLGDYPQSVSQAIASLIAPGVF